MEPFTATLFPIVLLFMSGLNYFGIRYGRPPMSILAAIGMVILAWWGVLYMVDLANVWSGKAREIHAIGVEVFPALGLVMVKFRSWVVHA